MATNAYDSTEYQPVQSRLNLRNLPTIDYEMREHKVGIVITWTLLFVSSGVAPIVLYFALRYGGNVELGTTLGVSSAIFGVFTVFSLIKRTWALLRSNSDCRPLGATRWDFDYFHINFMFFFLAITAIIVAGNVLHNIRVFSIGLPVLVAAVCFEVFLGGVLASFHVPQPFRISSVPKGDPIRSGVYSLAEDIIAVDAGQGQTYRRQLQDRYLASTSVQRLCWELDLFWGATGTIVGIGIIVAVFVVPNANVALVLGWAVPWGYAAIMAPLTIMYCKSRLRNEVADPDWIKKQGLLQN